jgi:hypothetical protein
MGKALQKPPPTARLKYRVLRGALTEWAQRERDGFVPLIRELTGFREYYLLQGRPDKLIAISMLDSADEALVSNEKAANWVRNNVMEFARGMPEVMVGDVLVAEVKEWPAEEGHID